MVTTRGQLQEALGYRFRDEELLERALTHRSVGASNNERLEFLGDAVLGLVISEALYHRFPRVEEGDLSRLRAHLVKRERLAEVAQELSLGELLHLGGGERKSGGRRRDSILADAVEALLAAVYLDGGYGAAHELVERLFESRIRALPEPEALKDPKTRLQEHLQGQGAQRPEYRLIEEQGEAHSRQFHVLCQLPDQSLRVEGFGRSRRQAEQAAARAALDRLNS